MIEDGRSMLEYVAVVCFFIVILLPIVGHFKMKEENRVKKLNKIKEDN